MNPSECGMRSAARGAGRSPARPPQDSTLGVLHAARARFIGDFSRWFITLIVCGSAAGVWADSVVVFNEIMYHPKTNEAQLEWIELQNQMSVDVDVSAWSLTGGIGV